MGVNKYCFLSVAKLSKKQVTVCAKNQPLSKILSGFFYALLFGFLHKIIIFYVQKKDLNYYLLSANYKDRYLVLNKASF